jgi:predicted dehydrogenase
MTLRWGFLGAGWIAERAMAPAVHAASNARLQAVASREAARSRALDPIDVHSSYEALLADPAVDAVYVCLANDQHLEWTVRALDAGKHVLCEKPLGLNADEARRMAETARLADRLLVEAVWTRWHPRFRRLAELALSGALGEIASLDSAFTFPGQITGNYRADPRKGGGALLDTGGYQVHAWVALTGGARSVELEQASSSIGPSGIDLTTSVTAVIDGVARATALSSFEQVEAQHLRVHGSQDVAAMGVGPAFTAWREETTLIVGGREEAFAPVDAYRLMVEEVSARIEGRESWVVPMIDSIRVAEVLDAIRSAAQHP